ncbi:MAG TPA: hypothetical protein VEZ89_07890 [Rubrivivax sp.]|nr:hypothetical protein [Rubrivivax sp.]
MPLTAQGPAAWNVALIEAAKLPCGRPPGCATGPVPDRGGPLAAHAQRRATGQTPWRVIAQLYAVLVQVHPSLVARTGYAVALAEAGDAAGALAVLDGLPPEAGAAYEPTGWLAPTCCGWRRHRAGPRRCNAPSA